MKTFDQVFVEELGNGVFGYKLADSTMSAGNFRLSAAADGSAVVTFDYACHHGPSALTDCAKPYWPRGETQGTITVKLDAEDHRNDHVLEPALTDATPEEREKAAIAEDIDFVLESYGMNRAQLTQLARNGQIRIEPLGELTDLQRSFVEVYIKQEKAEPEELHQALADTKQVPAAMVDLAYQKLKELCKSNVERTTDGRVLRFFAQYGKPHKTLGQVFEDYLAYEVTGREDCRLCINDIRPTWGYDGDGGLHPAVEFDACFTPKGEKTKLYADVKVTLTGDGAGDALAQEQTERDDVLKRLATHVDAVLDAYGYSREQIFEQVGFQQTVQVPLFILEALELYDACDELPEWKSDEDRKMWEETLAEIEENTGRPFSTICYAFKSGYDSFYGDLYTVSCNVPDRDHRQKPEFKPSQELTHTQKWILNEFLGQNIKLGRLPVYMAIDCGTVPHPVADGAFQWLNEKTEKLEKEAEQSQSAARQLNR